MAWREKLSDFFGDRQGAAAARVRRQIAQGCEWEDIREDIFGETGGGAPVSAVVDAIVTSKRWKLLTPLAEEAGDWIGLVDLIYRRGEFGPVPSERPQELEEIYRALKGAPTKGAKLAASFVNTVEIWACQRNTEACFDWVRRKPEFVPVPALGLAALADHPIEGNRLAMKILSSPAEIRRAAEAVDWVYADHGLDRDIAHGNLDEWRKKLEKGNNQPPPAPGPG
ncbi:MAG TPA: hypothetical protein VL625_12285 [Patescibacteria group bacterium]|nr:hypothetical protein [Patescibacteria group bacterium]